jgi:hypothetical protein
MKENYMEAIRHWAGLNLFQSALGVEKFTYVSYNKYKNSLPLHPVRARPY